jgi:hypothetical protein
LRIRELCNQSHRFEILCSLFWHFPTKRFCRLGTNPSRDTYFDRDDKIDWCDVFEGLCLVRLFSFSFFFCRCWRL